MTIEERLAKLAAGQSSEAADIVCADAFKEMKRMQAEIRRLETENVQLREGMGEIVAKWDGKIATDGYELADIARRWIKPQPEA